MPPKSMPYNNPNIKTKLKPPKHLNHLKTRKPKISNPIHNRQETKSNYQTIQTRRKTQTKNSRNTKIPENSAVQQPNTKTAHETIKTSKTHTYQSTKPQITKTQQSTKTTNKQQITKSKQMKQETTPKYQISAKFWAIQFKHKFQEHNQKSHLKPTTKYQKPTQLNQ